VLEELLHFLLLLEQREHVVRAFVAIVCSVIFRTRGFELIFAVMSVSMNPGWITLQRIPQSAYT